MRTVLLGTRAKRNDNQRRCPKSFLRERPGKVTQVCTSPLLSKRRTTGDAGNGHDDQRDSIHFRHHTDELG